MKSLYNPPEVVQSRTRICILLTLFAIVPLIQGCGAMVGAAKGAALGLRGDLAAARRAAVITEPTAEDMPQITGIDPAIIEQYLRGGVQ